MLFQGKRPRTPGPGGGWWGCQDTFGCRAQPVRAVDQRLPGFDRAYSKRPPGRDPNKCFVEKGKKKRAPRQMLAKNFKRIALGRPEAFV